jgi:hypothetical protein
MRSFREAARWAVSRKTRRQGAAPGMVLRGILRVRRMLRWGLAHSREREANRPGVSGGETSTDGVLGHCPAVGPTSGPRRV